MKRVYLGHGLAVALSNLADDGTQTLELRPRDTGDLGDADGLHLLRSQAIDEETLADWRVTNHTDIILSANLEE